MSSIPHANAEPRHARTENKKSVLVKVLSFIGMGVLVLFVAGYFFLNLGMYSASGYVKSYLETVGDKNAQGAKNYSGLNLDDTNSAIITNSSLSGLTNISIEGTRSVDGGRTEVAASYMMLEADGTEHQGSSVFLVEPTNKIFGIFDDWAFAEAPVATITVTVENDWRFRLNAENVSLPNGSANTPQTVTVLVPGLYQINHESNYFTSSVQNVLAKEPHNNYATDISLEPTETFVDLIRTELNGYLDECTTEQVLQPASCPFGKYLSDQTVTKPQWSISDYPEISFEQHDGGWLVPPTNGIAHLEVKMKSLFDGLEYTYSDDIPFKVSYLVVPDENGNFRIVEQLVD